jgi:hypothetical protein
MYRKRVEAWEGTKIDHGQSAELLIWRQKDISTFFLGEHDVGYN